MKYSLTLGWNTLGSFLFIDITSLEGSLYQTRSFITMYKTKYEKKLAFGKNAW